MPHRPKKGGGKDGALPWMISQEFSELSAMKEWGLTPKTWRGLCKRDRLKMWAFCAVSSKMKQMDDAVMDKRLEDMKTKQKAKKR